MSLPRRGPLELTRQTRKGGGGDTLHSAFCTFHFPHGSLKLPPWSLRHVLLVVLHQHTLEGGQGLVDVLGRVGVRQKRCR